MKIYPVGAKVFHAERKMNGHNKANNSCFSQKSDGLNGQ